MKIIVNFDFNATKKPGMGNFFTKSLTAYVYETIAPEMESKIDQYVNEVQLSAKPIPNGYSITMLSTAFSKQVVLTKENEDFYVAMDDCSKEFVKQILKLKEKHFDLKKQKRQADAHLIANIAHLSEKVEEKSSEGIIIEKQKRFAMKPMYSEEAVMQMELLGHNFFVYMDAETEEVNVVYKRKNNTYGLIEPEL